MTSVPTFLRGDTLRYSVQFRNAAGMIFDPDAAVTLSIKHSGDDSVLVKQYDPEDADEANGDIIKDGVGAYHCDLAYGAGVVSWRWEGDTTTNLSIGVEGNLRLTGLPAFE